MRAACASFAIGKHLHTVYRCWNPTVRGKNCQSSCCRPKRLCSSFAAAVRTCRWPFRCTIPESSSPALPAVWIDRILIQAQTADGVQKYRARFHLQKWQARSFDLELPSNAAEVEIRMNGLRTDLREMPGDGDGTRIIHVPLPIWRERQKLIVELKYNLLGTPIRRHRRLDHALATAASARQSCHGRRALADRIPGADRNRCRSAMPLSRSAGRCAAVWRNRCRLTRRVISKNGLSTARSRVAAKCRAAGKCRTRALTPVKQFDALADRRRAANGVVLRGVARRAALSGVLISRLSNRTIGMVLAVVGGRRGRRRLRLATTGQPDSGRRATGICVARHRPGNATFPAMALSPPVGAHAGIQPDSSRNRSCRDPMASSPVPRNAGIDSLAGGIAGNPS